MPDDRDRAPRRWALPASRRGRVGVLVAAAALAVGVLAGLAALLPPTDPVSDPSPTGTTPSLARTDGRLLLSRLVTEQNVGLDACRNDATRLYDCGPAPAFTGIDTWLNIPDGRPVVVDELRGSVVLVDFFAYTCINCRRATPHLIAWQDAYADAGLVVVGIHAPQWDFERDAASVAGGVAELGITYPVGVDDALSTFTGYRSQFLPSHYLVDADGVVRSIQFGEGNYAETEQLIRQLLADARPGVVLPSPTDVPDDTPDSAVITPETFLGWARSQNFTKPDVYGSGTAEFTYPVSQDDDTYAFSGMADVGTQSVQAVGAPLGIRLYYTASEVRMVLAGTGTVGVTVDGVASTIEVEGIPRSYALTATDATRAGVIEVTLPPGVQAYSFTFGGR